MALGIDNLIKGSGGVTVDDSGITVASVTSAISLSASATQPETTSAFSTSRVTESSAMPLAPTLTELTDVVNGLLKALSAKKVI